MIPECDSDADVVNLTTSFSPCSVFSPPDERHSTSSPGQSRLCGSGNFPLARSAHASRCAATAIVGARSADRAACVARRVARPRCFRRRWLTVLIYWMGSFFYRLEGLQVLVVPTAAALSLLPLAFPPVHPLTNTHLAAFKAHLVISLLAYSLFTIASLHVLMMAIMERRLHRGNLPQFMQSLPPLLTMERLLFQIIFAGFVLLTLTLGSGILFSEELFGKPMQFTHKTTFGILSWIIFGALLTGRALYGWRGRVAMRWTLAGFLSLFLAYIGSKFVLEVLLQR